MSSICVNGKIMENANPVAADDRSYRYGDGLFETMKVKDGRLLLSALHFERLFQGMQQLRITLPSHFTREKLQEQVIRLCEKNNCTPYGRVRLSVSAGNGGLYDVPRPLNYIIEAWPLSLEMEHLNSNGLVLGIFNEAHKSCDPLSNLKSASFLVYSQAALVARENKWNDALLLNQHGRLADTTIANIFLVKDRNIYTPSLEEGCIAGVMRRFLLSHMAAWGITIKETALTVTDLQEADEVFLSNAIRGMRWVKQCSDLQYGNTLVKEIYSRLQTIWE